MPAARAVLAPLLSLLEQNVGLRLQGSAPQALEAFDALARTLQASESELLERLASEPALLEELATQLTIPETHFFRIAPQIDALTQTVLPDLERRLSGKRELRFWSAGCSTGEEAYTLAMLAAQGMSARTEVGILGTDLHPESLETARRGRYGEWSFRDTSERARQRYFVAVSPAQHRTWQIADSLRERVRFEPHNLMSLDWSRLGRFDLILCRNVMIYFSNATAQRLIERFADQLQPGGWLILGPSDPPPLRDTLERCGFSVRFERGAMLYQKPIAGQPRAPAPSLPTLELPPSAELLAQFDATPMNAAPTSPHQDLATERALDFELQLQLGMDALEAGDFPAALGAVRRAAYLEPQSALAQFLLAQTLLHSAQPDRARVALRQAQRLLNSVGSVQSADLQRAVTALSGILGEP